MIVHEDRRENINNVARQYPNQYKCNKNTGTSRKLHRRADNLSNPLTVVLYKVIGFLNIRGLLEDALK